MHYLRTQKGWSQSELSKKIGLSGGYVSQCECGTLIPKGNSLSKLLIYLPQMSSSRRLGPSSKNQAAFQYPGLPHWTDYPPTTQHSKLYHFIYDEPCVKQTTVESRLSPEAYVTHVELSDTKNFTLRSMPFRYSETTPSVGDMSLLLASPTFSASLKKMTTWLEKV